MTTPHDAIFNRNFLNHQQHLQLKGLQPKTIDAYERALRRIGRYFHYDVGALSESQLLAYFTDLQRTHSWSSIKLDLYGLKFYYRHTLKKEWLHVDLIVSAN